MESNASQAQSADQPGLGDLESEWWLMTNALVFATHAHRFQRRKKYEHDPLDDTAKRPSYIVHPARVMRCVCTGVDWADSTLSHLQREVMLAALLHDTLEDTATTYEEVLHQFGQQVADYVQECTFVAQPGATKADVKRQQIARAATMSDGAAVVKLADMCDNLHDLLAAPPEDWTASRVQGYFVWKREMLKSFREVPGATRLRHCIVTAMMSTFKLEGRTYYALPRAADGHLLTEGEYHAVLQAYYAGL